MKTIIAPADFSMVSNNSCLYAAKLAADIKAELVLLHVMELPLAVAEYPVSVDLIDEEGVEKELETLKNDLLTATDNKINIRQKNILGSPEYEIRQLCGREKPFAVVMGTHSYGVLDRFFVESTTVYTARHLHYPVIIVPPDAKYQKIKKIALASDLKDIYETPAREIEGIVKMFNAEFEVFYVAKNQKNINRNSVASLMLDHILLDLDPKFHFVENEDIPEGVRAIAKEHGIDLLIIIPKKHGLFHKSQTKDFIFYSDIPVMAIHEDDPAQ
ncbi:MAG TPA: universal stress protein [Parafilimonas sp.]|nr:universal stress protein [Parafilimonas sp.]